MVESAKGASGAGITRTPTGTGKPKAKPAAGKATAASVTYDLSTKVGKQKYIEAEISAMLNLVDMKYAKYKDRPAYTTFLNLVHDNINKLTRQIQALEDPRKTVTIEGRMSPEKAAGITLGFLADEASLLTTDEKFNDAFGELK